MAEVMEKVSVTPFDAAKYLGDDVSQAAALSDALETGHRGVILDVLNSIARARGMTAIANETGIKREVLYASLGPNGNPTLETLLAVISALGLHLAAEPVEAHNDDEAPAPRRAAISKKIFGATAGRDRKRPRKRAAAG